MALGKKTPFYTNPWVIGAVVIIGVAVAFRKKIMGWFKPKVDTTTNEIKL